MSETSKVLMRHFYHQEWREKYVTLKEVADWTVGGRYAKRVRGCEEYGRGSQ